MPPAPSPFLRALRHTSTSLRLLRSRAALAHLRYKLLNISSVFCVPSLLTSYIPISYPFKYSSLPSPPDSLLSCPSHCTLAANAQRAMSSPHAPPAVFFGLALVYLASVACVDLLSDGLRVPFLHSEWLCWLMLAIAAKFAQHSKRVVQYDDRNHSDKLALAIAALGLCWTVGDARWAVVRRTSLQLHSNPLHKVGNSG